MRCTLTILLSASLCVAASVPSSVAKSPLSFEPNVGQASPGVKFLAHSSGRTIYLSDSGLEISGVELRFLGGKCAGISGRRPLSERHNYFRGSSSGLRALTDIPTYQRVRCEGIYPGIDAEFYGDRGSLEYDLIIAPRADPSLVRVAWNNAKRVRIDRDGDLIIDTRGGSIRQHKPVVYQMSKLQRKVVQGNYVLTGNNALRFSLGAYNPDLPLIIDPVLFAVDANAVPAGPIAVDASGNIYLTGTTETSSFEATAGSFQTAPGGGTCENGPEPPSVFPCPDAYVIKLDPTGAVIYATFLGGNGNDAASSIVVDSSGNAYIAGTTSLNETGANNFPTTPDAAFTKPGADGIDAFVAKLNASGNKLTYSTLIPELYEVTLTVDAQGAAYIAGIAIPASSALGSTGFPTTPGAFQTASMETSTGGIAKLNVDGSALVYATYLGGSNPNNYGDSDGATGIAVDALGNAYITGWTSSPDFPTTPGTFDTKPPDLMDVEYVAKLNPAGSALIYSTFLGESGGTNAGVIKTDAKGNAYILGNTASNNFPVTSGAFQPSGPGAPWAIGFQSGDSGQFLAALNADGTALIYSTYLTGASAFYPTAGLDVDAAGHAYVVGTASYNFPVTSGAFQRCVTNGQGDLFVVEFNPSGQAIGATYLGGTGTEIPSAIVAASNGSPYIAGTTSSTDFPGIVGAASGVSLTFVTQIQINNPQVTDGPCVSRVLQNAASFVEAPVVGGELVTIRGAGLGPAAGVSAEPDSNGRFPTQLAGVQVLFDGHPAPLLYVQEQQINTVVPWGVAMDYDAQYGSAMASVQVGGVVINTFPIPLAAAAPGVFATGTTNQAAVLNQDGTVNSPSNPAAHGSIISIYGTGGGPTDPAGQDGALAPLIQAPLTLPVTVQIAGNNSMDVIYAGAAPSLMSGVFQINARIPDFIGPGTGYGISVTIGSITSLVQPVISVQ